MEVGMIGESDTDEQGLVVGWDGMNQNKKSRITAKKRGTNVGNPRYNGRIG